MSHATSAAKGHEHSPGRALQQQQQQALRGEMLAKRGSIRPLRSWSSSEKRAPMDDAEGGGQRDLRRFSVAGPASSAGSTSGSRKSHTPRSLHTWAEEDDEMPDGARLASQAGRAMAARVAAVHGSHSHASGHQSRLTPKQVGGSVSASSSGSMYLKRVGGDGLVGFPDGGSSSSSSSGSAKHKRLRTPYSISIPSLVGSPLSFTQSFLASRTSMYAKHPPSSQIRAAHIDWDSFSMMEDMAAWGARGTAYQPGLHRTPMLGPAPAGSGMSVFQQQYLHHVYGRTPLAAHPSQLAPPLQHPSRQPSHPAAAAAAAHPGLHHGPPLPAGTRLPAAVHAAELDEAYAAMALADEWDKQATWDYVCLHHPLLASFTVASAARLSVRWRWCLLCIVAASAVCVLVGTPVALTILLARDSPPPATR
ncbi:hypothetical protein H4R19_002343 [Coemansia spiralis]|nr:hypothetical protein H4R19_002343 [Coemansia spiralis]